ncbi:polyprenyl synthetase family protein [Leucobacter allii]|uniref:Polyprenyl synthetase family protein n=1 Tax=Leucobacter allii TaxID=2932247 RepID=A0ABY4FRY0_9MICO|nr:polyprenyl synthetase family protein [Leucobacter allii]UOQ58929.1 polyprenyl synthetase family protein [Leucobacter allii]UOR03421.1 polyprenyl synthetase family protein [Leucobacter allii]
MRLFRGAQDRKQAKALQEQLELLESELMEHLRFASPVADAPARYLMDAGGKRIRPMLTLLTSELGTGPNPLVRRAAQAVEMTHLASLYHDDVMDDAQLRRGVPAAQTVWSNSVAILAGDLLFARASSLVSGMGEEAILLQARTFERLCLGQLHETVGPQEGDEPIAHYIQVLADKTGALIATAARMGVMFGEGPVEYADPVMEYGERIGVAFQLIDDVIDLSPQKDRTGKRAGTDLRAGVATLPTLLLRERAAAGDTADAALLARIDAGVAAIREGADPGLLDPEVDALRAHEVTRETEHTARRWAREAVDALDALPKSNVKRGLERMADSIVNREG